MAESSCSLCWGQLTAASPHLNTQGVTSQISVAEFSPAQQGVVIVGSASHMSTETKVGLG